MSSYRVVQYSIGNVIQEARVASEAQQAYLEAKTHRVYFQEYFGRVGAQTILVEHPYTDRDFLEDFANYYVKCFQPYKSQCTRLHFFTAAFTQADLDSFLRGENADFGQQALSNDCYLGFVVVKPLPKTVFGRTCLKTYSGGTRQFPATREYQVHVCGKTLSITSLAFQEQDQVVAACATSALWSVLQATSQAFRHPTPSPFEITRTALERSPKDLRAFPHKQGLDTAEMAAAIKSVNLEPFPIRYADKISFKAAIYGYLRGGIPPLMLISLFDRSVTGRPAVHVGNHAVAVTGYDLGPLPTFTAGALVLRSSRINKLYVHDDQVGPFARMEFEDQPFEIAQGSGSMMMDVLTTSWGYDAANPNAKVAVAHQALFPLYHKIRIPFTTALEALILFDAFYNVCTQNNGAAAGCLEWDCFLSTGGDYKAEVAASTLAGSERHRVLSMPLPRFVWRASAYVGAERKVDIILDATDVEQGRLVISVVEFDHTLASQLKAAPNLLVDQLLPLLGGLGFHKWLRAPAAP